MHLRYTLDKDGKRVYTLLHKTKEGVNTLNAHPGNFKKPIIWWFLARFSPDDKFSMERIMIKKRYNLLNVEKKKVMVWFDWFLYTFFINSICKK